MQQKDSVIRVFTSHDTVPKDYVFWLTRSVSERLAALEELRRLSYPNYDPRGPIQRVYRVTTLKRG